ncbi:hypothetical protein BDF22DRAFT_670195 [Syncephalis plumigaleata]|nr:hypothetical protein BDF22DRAFT_670195 [Syncephalis plumigaleata]
MYLCIMNKLLSIMLISCVHTIIQTLVIRIRCNYLSFFLSLPFFTFDYVLRNHLYVYRIVFSPIPLIAVAITRFHTVVSFKH